MNGADRRPSQLEPINTGPSMEEKSLPTSEMFEDRVKRNSGYSVGSNEGNLSPSPSSRTRSPSKSNIRQRKLSQFMYQDMYGQPPQGESPVTQQGQRNDDDASNLGDEIEQLMSQNYMDIGDEETTGERASIDLCTAHFNELSMVEILNLFRDYVSHKTADQAWLTRMKTVTNNVNTKYGGVVNASVMVHSGGGPLGSNWIPCAYCLRIFIHLRHGAGTVQRGNREPDRNHGSIDDGMRMLWPIQ